MRIKADVEFVRQECTSYSKFWWGNDMADCCGKDIKNVEHLSSTHVRCELFDGRFWTFPTSCLEEGAMFEKGQKYFVNFSTVEYMFVEESEHFAVFTCGVSTLAFSKSECTFQKAKEPPLFLKEEWKIEKWNSGIYILCGDYFIATFNKSGCHMIGGLPESLGLPLDENGAVVVKK